MRPDDKRHGSRAGYLRGCTCPPCVTANAKYLKHYRHRRLRGDTMRVPADKARAHITELLRLGMSQTSIASTAGLPWSTVGRIIRGQQQVSPETHRALLGVSPRNPGGSHYIRALGTSRRLQALRRLGYSLNFLQAETSYSRGNMHFLLHGGREWVEWDTAERIRTAYDRLHMVMPSARDRIRKGAITKARAEAEAKGWPPPLAWDDIDDPDEKPKGVPGVRGGTGYIVDESAVLRRMGGDRSVRLNYAERCELRRQWVRSGRSLNEMTRITGIQRVDRYAA